MLKFVALKHIFAFLKMIQEDLPHFEFAHTAKRLHEKIAKSNWYVFLETQARVPAYQASNPFFFLEIYLARALPFKKGFPYFIMIASSSTLFHVSNSKVALKYFWIVFLNSVYSSINLVHDSHVVLNKSMKL